MGRIPLFKEGLVTSDEQAVAARYGRPDLAQWILSELQSAGKDLAQLKREDLFPFEEFHLGGRKATRQQAAAVISQPGLQVLDIGCGVGGPARTLAAEFNCQVTGLDLSPAFLETALILTDLVGLSDRVSFQWGSALDLPSPDRFFDLVWMQHVGMNIKDKPALLAEIRRVLRPGGKFVFYELFGGPATALTYPLPWADDANLSFLVPWQVFQGQLEHAGFLVETAQDVTQEAAGWSQQALSRAPEAPPPLGVTGIIGGDYRQKNANLLQAMLEGKIQVYQGSAAGSQLPG